MDNQALGHRPGLRSAPLRVKGASRWASKFRAAMNQLDKKAWKKVIVSQFTYLVIIGIVVIFFYVRSGSLNAALTIGIALILGSFRFTYSEYHQCKRDIRDGLTNDLEDMNVRI